jgi:glycosyltransferase involved in cell wall biosynthesis
MRILTIANTPSDPSLGSGYVISGYAARMRARGHEVEVLEPADYEPLNRWRRAIRYRQTLGMAAACLRRRVASRFDLVEFYGAESWLAVAALNLIPRRKLLIVARSNGLETHCAEALADHYRANNRRRRPRMPFIERAFRDADGLITVSEFDVKFALERCYQPPDRTLALENPLRDDYLGLEVNFERPPMIGYCGSWLSQKGSKLLVDDLPPILRLFPAWKATLVGVGSNFRATDHFPADVVSRIAVIPRLDRDGPLRDLYKTFAIAVLPSPYESFSLAAAEAMACGCALAATPTGFAAGLRDGEEAVLANGFRTPALLGAMKRLVEDQELRKRIAQAGYRRVQSLRWEPTVDRLEATYLRWLSENRQRRRNSNSPL